MGSRQALGSQINMIPPFLQITEELERLFTILTARQMSSDNFYVFLKLCTHFPSNVPPLVLTSKGLSPPLLLLLLLLLPGLSRLTPSGRSLTPARRRAVVGPHKECAALESLACRRTSYRRRPVPLPCPLLQDSYFPLRS
jgi:hypothetical protein